MPLDQEEIGAIATSSEKAQKVLLKVSSALEAGLTVSFYKIIHIMKSYGNCDAKELSEAIECEIAGKQREEGQST